MSSLTLGIDFGTTNTVVALAEPAGPARLVRFPAPEAAENIGFSNFGLCFGEPQWTPRLKWKTIPKRGHKGKENGPVLGAFLPGFPPFSRTVFACQIVFAASCKSGTAKSKKARIAPGLSRSDFRTPLQHLG